MKDKFKLNPIPEAPEMTLNAESNNEIIDRNKEYMKGLKEFENRENELLKTYKLTPYSQTTISVEDLIKKQLLDVKNPKILEKDLQRILEKLLLKISALDISSQNKQYYINLINDILVRRTITDEEINIIDSFTNRSNLPITLILNKLSRKDFVDVNNADLAILKKFLDAPDFKEYRTIIREAINKRYIQRKYIDEINAIAKKINEEAKREETLESKGSGLIPTTHDIKRRIKVLVGEVGAGNNNPSIFNEVSHLLNLLLEHKKITKKAAKTILKKLI